MKTLIYSIIAATAIGTGLLVHFGEREKIRIRESNRVEIKPGIHYSAWIAPGGLKIVVETPLETDAQIIVRYSHQPFETRKPTLEIVP